MSHIAQASNVPIRNLDVLKKVCERNGWKFLEGQKSYVWFGRFVGDTPMPKDMTLADLGRCDHAISVPGASYTIGVRAQKDGTFRLVWDYFSSGGLAQKLGGEKMPVLVQAYNAELIKHETRRLGGSILEEETLPSGDVRIRLLAEA